jgi:hypothetical protein
VEGSSLQGGGGGSLLDQIAAWMEGPGRHYFQVRCAEGTFEVYQDTLTAVWCLRRAKLMRSGRGTWLSGVQRSAFAWH